jgi:hypothetical protein
VKVRDEGHIQNEAMYVVLGVDLSQEAEDAEALAAQHHQLAQQ